MNLLLPTCTLHSWNRCSSLAKYLWVLGPLKLWFHLHFSQKQNEWSSSPPLRVLVATYSHALLTVLVHSVCNCIMTQIGKSHWLKSNSSPLHPRLFLAGSVPDSIHRTDTQTAVSVWQAENVWGKGRRGLDEFNDHWYQMGNRNHEWLL